MARTKRSQSHAHRQNRVEAVVKYYANAVIRDRMREALGAFGGQEISAVYIVANDDFEQNRTSPRDAAELDRCLDEGKELYRSLWDRQYLVANLDIEYVNLDYPARPYEEFKQTYRIQRPAMEALKSLFERFSISPQHILSGRGHHLTWNIRRDSVAFLQLAQLGKVPPTVRARYSEPCSPRGECIGQALAKAFAGLGLTTEYLAHEVIRRAARSIGVPLTITAVETYSQRGVRECVSLDLSEYGDPLHTRSLRLPYSVYYKPLQQEDQLGLNAAADLPPVFMLPLGGLTERVAMHRMRDPEGSLRVARDVPAQIPEESAGTANLVKGYRQSRLARIHEWFYAQEHEPPGNWPRSYDATDLSALPASARLILEEPNDSLLKPAGMRHLVRVFLALGWHPRHIAGLMRSKFERDYGWGNEWYHYDAAMRADFYCRVFTGLIVCGLDDLSDFACPPIGTLAERTQGMNDDLKPFERSLKRRIKYDRLARRPIHGLFL